MIKRPQPGLRRSIKLLFARDGGRGRAKMDEELNMTSAVGLSMLLVVSLTNTQSAELLFNAPDIVLPAAYKSVALELAPVVAISPSAIALQGEAVMPTEEANDRVYKDGKLKPIINKLRTMARDFKETNPDKPFEGHVIIQADSNIPFSVINLVMLSCAESGYTNINYAVQKGAATWK